MTDIFTPGKIGNVEFKNRIVRSATWEALADKEGKPKDELVALVTNLARGEVGNVILGITAVAPEAKGMPRQSGIYTDGHVDAHRKLVESVHGAGGKVSIQIAHLGAQTTSEAIGGLEPVGASAIEHPLFKTTPRALSADEVKKLIGDFAAAARRSVAAGYDAIQLHGAHGYLLAQFASPRFNKRDDIYGEPGRLHLDVLEAVREESGSVPVYIKLNICDFLEGSTTETTGMEIALMLDKAGIDAIEVSGGTPASGPESPSRTNIRSADREAYFRGLARKVKDAVKCPVISVGGYRSPDVIGDVLSSGDADFVAISRPLIREPGLVKRWKDGDGSPATCVSCNGCFRAIQEMKKGVQCWVDLKEKGLAKDD